MNKLETIEKIKNISAKPKVLGSSDAKLLEIETIIKDYLVEHPKDTDMWLRLTMLEMTPPWEDPYRMVSYLNTILSYDAYNAQAILALAYIESLFFGTMKRSTFTILNNIKTNDLEILSMIEYVKALDYELSNKAIYEKYLIQSLNYYDKHVNNLKALGKYYLKHGQAKKGKELIDKAINNIKVIYDENYENTDITDINEFFDYYYKGTHTTEFVKEDMQELLHDC